MPAPPKHRAAIVEAAIALFRRNGYAATGLSEITARSGAPKGSLYHYFPGGKAEIGVVAVRGAGETVRRTLEQLSAEAPDAGALVRLYASKLVEWMERSRWRDGCPITTTLLEMAADDAAIREAGLKALGDWTEVLGEALRRDGAPLDRALTLARLAICGLEGALVFARVERSGEAILAVGEEMAVLFAQEAA